MTTPLDKSIPCSWQRPSPRHPDRILCALVEDMLAVWKSSPRFRPEDCAKCGRSVDDPWMRGRVARIMMGRLGRLHWMEDETDVRDKVLDEVVDKIEALQGKEFAQNAVVSAVRRGMPQERAEDLARRHWPDEAGGRP